MNTISIKLPLYYISKSMSFVDAFVYRQFQKYWNVSEEFILTIFNEKRDKIEEILENYIGKNISVTTSEIYIEDDNHVLVMIEKIIINEINKEIVFKKHIIVANKEKIIDHHGYNVSDDEKYTKIDFKRTICGVIRKCGGKSLIISES
jgi:hypothetical protein